MNGKGFTVMDDQEQYEITVKCRWGYSGTPSLEQMQTALTNAYATAFAELDRRLEGSDA